MDRGETLSATEKAWSPAVAGTVQVMSDVLPESIAVVDSILSQLHSSIRDATPAQYVNVPQYYGNSTPQQQVQGQPQQVMVRYATAGTRAMAQLFGNGIFALMAVLCMGFMYLVLTGIGLESGFIGTNPYTGQIAVDVDHPSMPYMVAGLLLILIYPIMFMFAKMGQGQAIHHYVFGLQVVDAQTHKPIGFFKCFFRMILKAIFLSTFIWIIDVFMILTSTSGGSLADTILGTSVVVQ